MFLDSAMGLPPLVPQAPMEGKGFSSVPAEEMCQLSGGLLAKQSHVGRANRGKAFLLLPEGLQKTVPTVRSHASGQRSTRG